MLVNLDKYFARRAIFVEANRDVAFITSNREFVGQGVAIVRQLTAEGPILNFGFDDLFGLLAAV